MQIGEFYKTDRTNLPRGSQARLTEIVRSLRRGMPHHYPTDEMIRDLIIKRAEAYSLLTGVSSADIGKRALGNTAFLYQIKHNRNFTIETYSKFMGWMDEHWPSDHVPSSKQRKRHPMNGKKKRS
jgi:hypothetical protein